MFYLVINYSHHSLPEAGTGRYVILLVIANHFSHEPEWALLSNHRETFQSTLYAYFLSLWREY